MYKDFRIYNSNHKYPKMVSETIHWKYDYMYKWYTKNQNNSKSSQSSNITAIIYQSQKAKKTEVDLEPFIKQNITYVGLSPIQNKTFFPNGLYTVMDDNINKQQWMYFVYPMIKKCDNSKTEVNFADHFTFCYNKSDKKKSCHFHNTFYNCVYNLQKYTYTSVHRKDHFPDTLEIDIKTSHSNSDKGKTFLIKDTDIITKPAHEAVKPIILELMTVPWKDKLSSNGGAKKKTTEKQKARKIISEDFSSLWKNIKIKEMFAFGIRNESNNKITWSVRFARSGREYQGRAYTAYVFETDTNDEKVFQEKLATLMESQEDID